MSPNVASPLTNTPAHTHHPLHRLGSNTHHPNRPPHQASRFRRKPDVPLSSRRLETRAFCHRFRLAAHPTPTPRLTRSSSCVAPSPSPRPSPPAPFRRDAFLHGRTPPPPPGIFPRSGWWCVVCLVVWFSFVACLQRGRVEINLPDEGTRSRISSHTTAYVNLKLET